MDEVRAEGARGVLSTSAGTHLGAFTAADWGLFVAIGGIWGASFLFIAIGLNAFEPGLVTLLRVAFGAGVLWLFPAARAPVGSDVRGRVIALSFLWVAIPMTLFPLAEQRVSTGLAGMVNGTVPIFATLIGAVMLRRMPGRTQLVGLVLGFAGMVAIAAPALGAGSSEAIGVLMLLAAVLCYGLSLNILTPAAQRYGSLPVMARVLALATIWTAPLGLWSVPGSSFAWGSLAAVMALGMLGTGLAFVLMGRLAARVGSSRASFAIYVTPVVALILGAVFRDEAIRALSLAGHRPGDRWRHPRLAQGVDPHDDGAWGPHPRVRSRPHGRHRAHRGLRPHRHPAARGPVLLPGRDRQGGRRARRPRDRPSDLGGGPEPRLRTGARRAGASPWCTPAWVRRSPPGSWRS